MKLYLYYGAYAAKEDVENIANRLKEKGHVICDSVSECDMIFSLGGDGTLLKAAQHAIACDKPLAGINCGRLGYLCLLKQEEIDGFDEAIDVYHKDPTPPVMIPSGGQGADETVSEARAMADYLLGKGIPEEKIILEDRSTTTYENLLNSKSIIDSRADGHYIALVTSNYHVYRALRHCRKIGLECTGIGSRVAFYYWPSALIREYIAVHAEPKHLVMFIAGWLACIVPALYLLLGNG